MFEYTRYPQGYNTSPPGEGIQMATVIGHADPTFDGRLEVTLQRNQGNSKGEAPYIVRYSSPFFGNTAYEFQGFNRTDFNDTQKSYGMWFVPPDIGVDVLVVFINGEYDKGFWIACIPPTFAHRMVPAIGADFALALTDEQRARYNTSFPLPVGEANRRINSENQTVNEDRIAKPLHPVAETYLRQGTVEDAVRGPVQTTSKRTPPNSVYGISTPGPIDRRPGAPERNIGDIVDKTDFTVPVSRLGGTTFVMDDGDDTLMRRAPASELAYNEAYADVFSGEQGNAEIPSSEYFRVRTRTGHEILMHNSEDLIYITNSKGTAWIELTSDGKIDVYSKDSISIRTESDFNFKADRDFNVEAGRNINLKATATYRSDNFAYGDEFIIDDQGRENGRIQLESKFNTNLLVGANMKIETRTFKNENQEDTDGNLDINIKGNTKITTGIGTVKEEYRLDIGTRGNVFVTQTGNLDISTIKNTKITTAENFDLKTTGNNTFTAGKATDILSGGNHAETAAKIDMNGPKARQAEVAAIVEIAETIDDLVTYQNRRTNSNLAWNESKYQENEPFNSIMRRVPQHEPWYEHENLKPLQVKKGALDREQDQ